LSELRTFIGLPYYFCAFQDAFSIEGASYRRAWIESMKRGVDRQVGRG